MSKHIDLRDYRRRLRNRRRSGATAFLAAAGSLTATRVAAAPAVATWPGALAGATIRAGVSTARPAAAVVGTPAGAHVRTSATRASGCHRRFALGSPALAARKAAQLLRGHAILSAADEDGLSADESGGQARLEGASRTAL